jgi:hypothetical protein
MGWIETSPATAGRRALSADVHVRADAAGWSRWVAELKATDATLWLLPHRACTPRNLPLDNTSGSCYALGMGGVPILFLVNTDRKKGDHDNDTQR